MIFFALYRKFGHTGVTLHHIAKYHLNSILIWKHKPHDVLCVHMTWTVIHKSLRNHSSCHMNVWYITWRVMSYRKHWWYSVGSCASWEFHKMWSSRWCHPEPVRIKLWHCWEDTCSSLLWPNFLHYWRMKCNNLTSSLHYECPLLCFMCWRHLL